jgi:hypothetical protein
MSDVLQSQDKVLVSAGTDILVYFLNQDPNLLRSYIARQENSQEGNSLLGLLVSKLHPFSGSWFWIYVPLSYTWSKQ